MPEPDALRELRNPISVAKGFALILLPLLSYLPAIGGGFIWDDDEHVYANPVVISPEGFRDIWLTQNAIPQYYPLVHSTFWLEYRLWGPSAVGYHTINVLLHTLNAILVWRLLKAMEIPGAWLAAVIFAIHPVHVESVAWISERKNVLSGPFYLLAAGVYWRNLVADGEEQSADRSRRPWFKYIVFHVLFAAALLSKSVVATLPAALLLMVWLRQGRISLRHFALLAPAFAIGLFLGLRTAAIEREFVGASGSQFDWSFAERCLIAGKAVWFYAAKLIWPYPLAFFYPKWEVDASSAVQWLFPISAFALVILMWALRRRIGRGPLVAALYFGGTLLPALGFVNFYPMRFSFVADHFQYLASLGLISLFAALAATWMEPLASRGETAQKPVAAYSVRALAGVFVCVLCVLTARHAYVLADNERLFRDTLAKNPNSVVAHNQLGLILRQRGELREALKHFLAVDDLDSGEDPINRANVLATEGEILLREGKTDEAIEKLQAAIEAWPSAGRFYLFLAEAQRKKGDLEAALRNATTGLERGYKIPGAYLLHARLASQTGDYRTAVTSYQYLMSLAPDPQAAAEFAWIRAAHSDPDLRRLQEAESLAGLALQSRTGVARALDALAAVEAHRRNFPGAVSYAEQALDQALNSGDFNHADEIRERLEIYRMGGVYEIPGR